MSQKLRYLISPKLRPIWYSYGVKSQIVSLIMCSHTRKLWACFTNSFTCFDIYMHFIFIVFLYDIKIKLSNVRNNLFITKIYTKLFKYLIIKHLCSTNKSKFNIPLNIFFLIHFIYNVLQKNYIALHKIIHKT